MAITVLILWVVTAGAGVTLLVKGNAARRRAAGPVPKTHIHDILAKLLPDSELVVGVGWDNAI